MIETKDNRPKILLLDTIAVKGVKSLEEFAEITDGRAYSQDQITAEIADFHGLVVKSNNQVSAELLQRAVNLKAIGRAGSGIDNIDMAAARERNIQVITSPEGNVQSVAEYVLCMTIFLSHQFRDAHDGSRRNDFRRHTWQGRNLNNLTVGLVGLGNIGLGVLKKIAPLCRNVLGYDPYGPEVQTLTIDNFTRVTGLRRLLEDSDVISLHLPLTAETRKLLNPQTFSYMKKGAILINSSRGQIIDDEALLAALKNGTVEAAALDALYPDPVFNESPEESVYSHFLVHHPKIYYTPHIAAGSKDALEEVACTMAERMKEVFIKSKESSGTILK